jgi:antitoxin ParD1/3/4
MPNISLTDTMQDYVERQVASGSYANVSEVVRAGLRRLMEDDGAAAFYRLRRELQDRMAEPPVEGDLHELLFGDLKDAPDSK